MNKEEMIEIILDFENEMLGEYNETYKAFGYYDTSAQRLQSKLAVLSELKDRLELNED